MKVIAAIDGYEKVGLIEETARVLRCQVATGNLPVSPKDALGLDSQLIGALATRHLPFAFCHSFSRSAANDLASVA